MPKPPLVRGGGTASAVTERLSIFLIIPQTEENFDDQRKDSPHQRAGTQEQDHRPDGGLKSRAAGSAQGVYRGHEVQSPRPAGAHLHQGAGRHHPQSEQKELNREEKAVQNRFFLFFYGRKSAILIFELLRAPAGAARQETSFPRRRIPGRVRGKGRLLKNNKEVIYYAYCNYGYQLGR